MTLRSLVTAAGLGTALVAAVSLAAPAMATTTGTGTAGQQLRHDRLVRACARVPFALDRAHLVQERIDGPASLPGSMAHLQARIDKATAAGKTDLVTLLNDRMKVRKDLVTLLPDRITMLQDAQRICTEHGLGGTTATTAPTTTSPANS